MFKRHLLKRVPISAIYEELEIAPTMFYRWPQELLENAHLSFETDRKARLSRQPRIAGSQQQQDRKTSPALKGWAKIDSRYATAGMR